MGYIDLGIKLVCIICDKEFIKKSFKNTTCSRACAVENSNRGKAISKALRFDAIKPENLPGEIWLPVNGHNGKYLISNKGRMKSVRFNKEKIHRSTPSINGYAQVKMCVNYCNKSYKIHRLVAEHFLEKIEGRDSVNHIDENKLNNCVENLEWVTNRENVSYSKIKNKVHSTFVGVTFDSSMNKYFSRILIVDKRINLGYFDNEIDAHNAYQKALKDNNLKNKYSIS